MADTLPTISNEAASEVGVTTAKLTGKVNPNGTSGDGNTTWRIQLSPAGTDHGSGGDENWSTVGESQIEPPASEEANEVEVQALAGFSYELNPGETYEFRLQAENGGGQASTASPYPTFTMDAVTEPTLSVEPVSVFGSSTAQLSGHIDPEGGNVNPIGPEVFPIHWEFQVSTDGSSWSGAGGGEIPAPEAGESNPIEVSAEATGLTPHTAYQVRLHTYYGNFVNFYRETDSAPLDPAFTTEAVAPKVGHTFVTDVSESGATLNAEVNPGGDPTTVHFEYVDQADYEATGFAVATSTPESTSIGQDNSTHAAQAPISGLEPSTEYRFRAIATNSVEAVTGEVARLHSRALTGLEEDSCPNAALRAEQHSAFLPDCRAYEMVSPPDKNGAEVIPQTDKTHLTADGNKVTFSSLGGFGDVEGSGFDFEYMAERTGQPGTSGWSTHGINPIARATTLDAADANGSTYVDAFTPDLSAAIYRTWRPLVDAPNAADVSNLYRVSGLSGGEKTTQILSDSASPHPSTWLPFFEKLDGPRIAGASTDLSTVVFESPLALTPDAPPYPAGYCEFYGSGCPTQLYENVNGAVHLVSRIPEAPATSCDDETGPACVAAPSGQMALSATQKYYSQKAMSKDGRRIYFGAGALYLREDGHRTVLVAQSGVFGATSDDGSRAFFVTSESLVPADTDTAPDVYMYEPAASPGSRYTLVSAGNSGNDGYADSFIGTSADGHTAFFVSDGQLVAGEPNIGGNGLYAWHDGQLRYIGYFYNGSDGIINSAETVWSFVETATTSRITPDGQYLLFMAEGNSGFTGRGGFPGYDNAGHREFYLYDVASGKLACVSCNPSGSPATADARIDMRDNAATSDHTSDSAQALTDDGKRVFFDTTESLVAGDTNGQLDAYEYDAQTGRVQLLSSGTDDSPSYVIDATPDGSSVFILTRERLVGWDTDERYDLYDARVNGGLPEPAPAPAACGGDSCLGAGRATPGAAPSASEAAGRGNPKPRKACPRGRRARERHGKVRCVKRRHRRHAAKHKRANADRRASR